MYTIIYTELLMKSLVRSSNLNKPLSLSLIYRFQYTHTYTVFDLYSGKYFI